MSIKSETQTRSRSASLRRSPRFLPPEKLNPEISFNKSVEIHPKSSSIAPSTKISASICMKNQLKRSRSKSGAVLEETQSCPRRSPRLASQQVMEVCKISKESAEISKDSDELEGMSKLKVEIVPKKRRKTLSSQIRRSSSRLMNASNALMKAGATKREDFAESFKGNRGELVLESRVEDCFVITKEIELLKAEREKKECFGRVAWSNEQEEALKKAFLMAKPSPHFWKKVSKMVPGKSAQECFDKIHSSIVTPLSPPPRPRMKKKSLSPIPPFNLSTNIFPHISEIDAGRLGRCRTKKLAAQKTVRHLLRKHRLADQTKAADHFSLLESSPINIPVNVLNNISNLPLLSPQSGEKLSANSKLLSRFKLLTTPKMDPSPQVLKQIKNRDLHDRYIDQLHYREARRLLLAKKSKFDDLDRHNCVSKPEHGALKVARTALISDAKSFISHFKHTVANSMDELNVDCSDDDDEEDIDVSDLDE